MNFITILMATIQYNEWKAESKSMSHPASSSPSCLLLRFRKNLCHGVVIAEERWRARVRARKRVREFAEEDRV